MKRTITMLFVVCLALVPRAGAQEAPEDLVQKLGSRSFQERETAAKKLEKIGLAALPALRAAYASADLETRRRSVVVMERIEDLLMRERITNATPVHLKFADTPLAGAVRDIEKRMQLRLGPVKPSAAVTVDTGVLPYWQAWRAFTRAAQLDEADYAASAAKFKRLREEEVWLFMEAMSNNRVQIRPIVSIPPINFADVPSKDGYAEDDRHSMRVRVRWHGLQGGDDPKAPLATFAVFAVELRPEPRLQFPVMPRAEITKIVAADGKDVPVKVVKPFRHGVPFETEILVSAYAGEIQYGGLVQLKSIVWDGPMRPLKEIHGQVRMELPVRPPMIEVAKVYESVGAERKGHEGVTLKILEANRKTMRLRVWFDDVDCLSPKTDAEKIVRVRPGVIGVRGPMDVAMERIELQGPHGMVCPRLEASYERDAEGKGYFATFHFEQPPSATEELTLVLTKARRTVTVEMPFVVRDVSPPGMVKE